MLIVCTLAVWCAACGNTATIQTTDYRVIEAKIKGGDAENIYIGTEYSNKRTAIPRDKIMDIDHPGNGLAIVGASMIAAGGLVLMTSTIERNQAPGSEADAFAGLLFGSFAYIVPGALFAWWGGSNWYESRTNAALPESMSSEAPALRKSEPDYLAPPPPPASVGFTPMIYTEREVERVVPFWGAGLSATF